jgi:hypothetical protein
MLSFCDDNDLSAIINGPLGKGLLTGKFDRQSRFEEQDLRRQLGWNSQDGPLGKGRAVLEQLRDILTSDGRTLAQAALGALWHAANAASPSLASRASLRCATTPAPSSTARSAPARCMPSPTWSPRPSPRKRPRASRSCSTATL